MTVTLAMSVTTALSSVRQFTATVICKRALSTAKTATGAGKAVFYYPRIEGASLRPESPIRMDAENVTIEPGEEFFWCACGYSKKQPRCDGSHRKRLVELRMQGAKVKNDFVHVEPGTYQICSCKYTTTAPFCDDSCRKP